MSAIKAIRDALENIAETGDVSMGKVYYGACQDDNLEEWNYFVFNKLKTAKSTNRKDFQTFYQVHIIHEDYIPDGYVEDVIAALEASDQETLRCTSDDINYNYTFKGKANTNTIIEIATINIFRPEKRC